MAICIWCPFPFTGPAISLRKSFPVHDGPEPTHPGLWGNIPIICSEFESWSWGWTPQSAVQVSEMDSCRTWPCGWRREHFVSGHFCIRVCNFWKKFCHSFIPRSAPVPRLFPVSPPLFGMHRESQWSRGVSCVLPGYCAWQSCGVLLCLSPPAVGCSSRLVKTGTLEGEGFKLVLSISSCFQRPQLCPGDKGKALFYDYRVLRVKEWWEKEQLQLV